MIPLIRQLRDVALVYRDFEERFTFPVIIFHGNWNRSINADLVSIHMNI